MTINTDYAPVVYDITGNGTTDFPFNWEVADATHVQVVIDDEVVSSGQYTVILNGVPPIYSGGIVRFNLAPVGSVLKVIRVTDIRQNTDYERYDSFPAETHEFALDKLTLISQEIDDRAGTNPTEPDPDPTPPPDGGPYLPLAGGTMDPGAAITFVAGTGQAKIQGGSLFGTPSFVIEPVDTGGNELLSIVLKSKDGLLLTASPATDLWEIEGRADLENATPETIVIKKDLDGFLPLTGGTMEPAANITFAAGPGEAKIQGGSLFGQPSFVIEPVETGGTERLNIVLKLRDGVQMVGNQTGGVWTIEGRDAFETLPDNAVAIKSDLAAPPPPGGEYLPLAGGTMDPGANITFIAGPGEAKIQGGSLFGIPSFVIEPVDTGGTEQLAVVFKLSDGASMQGDPATGVWEIDGRPPLASLPDNAIALKGDLPADAGGPFLPLAGGIMDNGANIQFIAGTGRARISGGNLLGLPAYVVEPTPGVGTTTLNIVLKVADGKQMQGNAADGVWEIDGRASLASLPDNGLIIKSDLNNYLPLAGGLMDDGSNISFPALTSRARIFGGDFFGTPAFIVEPDAGVGPGTLNIVMRLKSGASLIGNNLDGVWSIDGRADYASIPNDALVIKQDLLALQAAQAAIESRLTTAGL